MGGQGSGRPPGVKSILNNSMPKQTPIGTGLILPNYSGIKNIARKDNPSKENIYLRNDGDVGNGTYTFGNIQTNSITGSSTMQISGTKFVVSISGLVGIGTATPGGVLPPGGIFTAGAVLDLLGGTNKAAGVLIRGYSTSYGLDLWSANNGNSFIDSRGDGYTIRFRRSTAATAADSMIIDGTGKVGIGTITPSEMLEVIGNISGTGLIGTSITGTGTISGSKIITVDDYTTMSGAYVANVVYGTGATPPTASGFPIGTIYIQYTP